MQTDTFFHVPCGRLKLREFGDGTGELIAYDRPDTVGPKLSTYIRTPVANPSAMREILTRALGLRTVVRTRRLVFLVGQTRIHLDEVDGPGSFIELEVVLRDDQSVAEGEQIAANLMARLGIGDRDLISGAYADLQQT